MKKYFVTGILIWVPILISFLFIRVIFRFSDYALMMLPSAYRPDVLLGVHIPGLGLIFVFVLLWLICA